MAKTTLNPLTDTPTKKTEVTKDFMLAYMKSDKASKEDKEWFKGIVSQPENKTVKMNPFTNENYEDIDIAKVRKAFIERFYPNLSVKKKGKKSFIDEIMEL